MVRLPAWSRSPAQQGDGGDARAPALGQAPEGLALVGKEADPQLMLLFGWQAEAGPVGGQSRFILLPALALDDEAVLAQEAARFLRETREEEVLVEAPAADLLGGGEAVAILDPALG